MQLHRKVVLVLDDDPNFAQLIAHVLEPYERFGLVVHVVSRIKELRFLLDNGVRFEGAVIDIRLPDGSGFDAVALLREQCPGVPMRIVTGFPDLPNLERANRLHIPLITKTAVEALTELGDEIIADAHDNRAAIRRRVDEMQLARPLTDLQYNVLLRRVLDHPRKQIAADLGISDRAVASTLERVARKVEADSLTALLGWLRTGFGRWRRG